ncbi:unnamed protein product, partial [marine sediment metagenome]
MKIISSKSIIKRNHSELEEIRIDKGYKHKIFEELHVLAIIATFTAFSLIFSLAISKSGIYYGTHISWGKRILATFNTGYDVYISDHKVWFPLLQNALNPNLLQNDLLLSFNQNIYTLFDEFIVFLVPTFNLDLFSVFF